MQNIKELAIIGDSFAAAVIAIHLLRQGLEPSKLILIGLGSLGKGSAYSCIGPFFHLKVREDLPAVFPEEPLHFARWAEVNVDDPEEKTNAGFFI